MDDDLPPAGPVPGEPAGERDGPFAATGLDLEAVRALFERLTSTSLGLRAVRERGPLDDGAAREALGRVREARLLERSGERPSLAGVADVAPALAGVRRFHRPLEKAELATLVAFLAAAERLADWFRERRDAVPLLAETAAAVPGLAQLAEELGRTVDERGEVRDEASPRLARLRREARALDERLAQLATSIAARPAVRPFLSDFAVHRRGGRRVLAVRARSSGRVQGLVHDHSQSGETVFVEPSEAIEPGNRLAELELEARAEEARIAVELTRAALAREAELLEAARRVAEVELALASSDFCRIYGASVPLLSGGEREGLRAGVPPGGLALRGARHPLLVDQQRRGALEEVVPIDVHLGGDFDLLVITGPNTGGKTLALKTVGVAALSVRMGWPVCCSEKSVVPLYEGVVADIGDEQEISQSLSTFASHVARIRAGLERAGERTLVLLDELGGGTDPDEGAALGDAILEHLLRRAIPTIATTHLGVLKEFAYRHARAENASVEFDARTLRPRYRLLVGTPGESNALAIAERLGLAEDVLARARERLRRRDSEVQELMAQMRGVREDAERARSEAERRLEGVERAEETVRAREADLARRGELLEAEAQRGLEERVRQALRGLEAALALVPQVPAGPARLLGEALEAVRSELRGASLTERRRAFLAALRKGQLVYVPRYKQRCVVQRIDRSRGEVALRLGKMSLTVPFEEITWYESL